MKEQSRDLEQMKRQYEEIAPPSNGMFLIKEAINKAKAERRMKRRKSIVKSFGVGAAAVLACLVILPNLNANVAYAMSNIPIIGPFVDAINLRNYQVEEDRFHADVNIPELIIPDLVPEKDSGDTVNLYEGTINQINREVDLISRKLIREFEENMDMDLGYADLIIRYEVLETTQDYFTLKLITYWGAGSGYEKDYYYTVDLHTGKRIALKDLFRKGTDYKGIISENIKAQMRSQMALDDSIVYWIDQDDVTGVPAWDFHSIEENQSFYIDKDGQIVITFSEGDVAPMATGCVEFVIPNALLEEIRL